MEGRYYQLMATKKVDVPDYLRNLIMSLRVEGNVVHIDQQLDRDTYVALNKVLGAMGGKWDRRARGHIFSGDPRKKIAEALEIGEVVDTKKTYEFFETPAEIANLMVHRGVVFGDLASNIGNYILEPSAGEGAIADVIRAHVPSYNIHVVEIDPEKREILKAKGYRIIGKDFLKTKKKKLLYDRVIMNPPFSNGKDIDHVMHAFRFLRPGGRLVSVMSGGTVFRSDKKATKFRDFVDRHGGLIEPLPEGAFEASGTGVNTVLLTLDKPVA